MYQYIYQSGNNVFWNILIKAYVKLDFVASVELVREKGTEKQEVGEVCHSPKSVSFDLFAVTTLQKCTMYQQKDLTEQHQEDLNWI